MVLKYKMKIKIISDLHLEFLSPSQIEKLVRQIKSEGDVLVLAGDVGNGKLKHYQLFLEEMSKKFPKIFVVAGNHEYYGNEIDDTNQHIKLICEKMENVSFLCSSWEDYGGFRWIGTTLWSNISDSVKCFTNDVLRIKNFPVGKYNKLHKESVDFLSNTLTNSTRCIVITHYLPSMGLIHEKYQNENIYNQWFASSLDDLIEKYTDTIPLWIYGHTHDFSHVRLFNTEMVCNPYGYQGENRNPNLNYVVEIGDEI